MGGTPERSESKSQAVLGHFFVLTRPFVHQHPPSAPIRRTPPGNQEPHGQTHCAQLELTNEATERKKRQTSAECGRPGGILKELFLWEASFLHRLGCFQCESHSAPKRHSWVSRKVLWGLVAFPSIFQIYKSS